MAYVTGTKYNALDTYPAASQNQDVDNDTFLYDNLQTEINTYAADRPSAAAAATSDEFNSTVLNVAWTAYTVAAGTIDPLETGVTDKYDLATWRGWLAIQSDVNDASVDMNAAGVRKAYTPGTGPWSVIAKVSIVACGTTVANDSFVGIMVSDDATPTNYTNLVYGRSGGSTWRVEFYQNAGVIATLALTETLRTSVYLALLRESAGGVTTAWVSYDGISWMWIGSTATAPAIAYLWLGIRQAGPPAIRPAYLCDWIRTFAAKTLLPGRAGNT